MDMSKAYTPIIMGIVIGLVIGFAAGWYWTENKYSSKDTESEKTLGADKTADVVSETAIQQREARDEAISVSDQSAGQSVVVSSVTLSESGWVAVRELQGDELGNILGATRVRDSGTTQNVSVPLLRPTVAGQAYAVVIYQDDGGEEFNFNFDSLIVKGGAPVSEMFMVE